MRRGFTLIELLAVIVILAIILVIAVPQILNVIQDSKVNSYSNQIKLVEEAARIYHTSNTLTFNNNQAIIKLSDLQSSKLLETNIKDTRTGNAISTDSWVLVTKNGDSYTYTYGYDTGGLILYYDGIYNGGLNIHNDNASTNQAILTDLSGNNNNGTLTNFDYTSTSGWTSNGLLFDGVDDGIYVGTKLINLFKTSNTIEMVVKFDEVGRDILFGNYNSANSTNYEKTATSQSRVFVNNGMYDTSSTNTYATGTALSLSFIFDKTNNVIIEKNNNVTFHTFSSTQVGLYTYDWIDGWFGRDSRTGTTVLKGTIYSIRIYNRILSDAEIQRNYGVDKLRFGL